LTLDFAKIAASIDQLETCASNKKEFTMLNAAKEGVHVICGNTSEKFIGFVGKYVGSVKRVLGPGLSINYFTKARVNDVHVGLQHTLQDGDTLEFRSVFGVKGNDDEPYELHAARALVQFDSQLRGILSSVKAKDLDAESSVCLALSLSRQHFQQAYGPINHKALEVLGGIATDIRRVADSLSPTPPQKVGTGYIADRLACSKTWITELARDKRIPKCCIVQGTGNGKPWKFHRREVDNWIEQGATILDQIV